jgi:hypothetical protein
MHTPIYVHSRILSKFLPDVDFGVEELHILRFGVRGGRDGRGRRRRSSPASSAAPREPFCLAVFARRRRRKAAGPDAEEVEDDDPRLEPIL